LVIPLREIAPAQPSAHDPEVLDQSSREFLDLLALLVLGCLIAALVQTWLPRSWLLPSVVPQRARSWP
jgi:uncharacterized membrane protein YraQ (UPF0718 family)